MLTALFWLLDLDQGHSASSSSMSSTSSCSCSSDADPGIETNQPATHTTFASVGGHFMTELHISSVAAATLSSSASEAASPPHGAVYDSPRYLEGFFADLDARKATLFASPPCQKPAGDVDLALDSLVGRGETLGSSASPKIVPLGSLRSYANEAVSLSPIPSPAPVPVPETVATSSYATYEGERLLFVNEGVMLSTRLSSPGRGAPRAGVERVDIANHRPVTSTTGARMAVPTQKSRIFEWDEEVRSRRQASPPPGPGANRDEGAARDGTEAQERGERVADAECEEARLVQRAMKAALMVSTSPHAPTVVHLHPSNPFLDPAVNSSDETVPGYFIEGMCSTPAQADSDVVHLTNGLVTVTPMDASDLRRQVGHSSSPPTQPPFDFS
ncbi:hypothetical_protein (plasmid) [Leishmania braziliensis MHOM/BR/75/M2904]|nr:hypothetical_protein [Leishmania braziliensis MHOM/BR/75/M2904]